MEKPLIHMLNEADRELISAAVDGELTSAEELQFRALIEKFPQAKAHYEQLLQDQLRLKSLPRALAPKTVFPAVMSSIQPVCIELSRRRRSAARRKLVFSVAIAASFLLAVGSATFVLRNFGSDSRPNAKQLSRRLPLFNLADANSEPTTREAPPQAPPPREVTQKPVASGSPVPVVVAVEPESKPETTNTQPIKPILAAPINAGQESALEVVEVKLPLLLPVAELNRDDVRDRIRQSLSRNPQHRIDVFARDTVKAAELLTSAGKGISLTLAYESIASERIKRKMPSAWAVYTDGLSAEEVATWFSNLAKLEAQNPASEVVTYSHWVPMQNSDSREVREIFGIELNNPKRTRGQSAPRSIAADTADQVSSALKKNDKSAILVTYLPMLARINPVLSKDLKSFLERRGERKQGTVSLMIVIRPANG